MKTLYSKLETQKDYIIVVTAIILFFIASKNVVPIYLYALFALIASFYFFPVKLIVNRNETSKYERTILLITGIVFSTVLTFSILNLYVPESSFFRYTVMALGFINFFVIVYHYLKHNNLLVLNFIFSLLIASIV